MGGQNGKWRGRPVPNRSARARWEGEIQEPGARPVTVRIDWHWVPGERGPVDTRTEVFVDGRKVNARQRRRWVDLLAQKGVTFERTVAALDEGRDRVSDE